MERMRRTDRVDGWLINWLVADGKLSMMRPNYKVRKDASRSKEISSRGRAFNQAERKC